MKKTTIAKAMTLAAALVVAGMLPAAAQQDSRWTAFVGCWVPAGVAPDSQDEAGLLCFRPAGGGVEMFNVVAGEVTATEQLVADGQARQVSAEGCTGSERVSFSEDGMRAYTRSEFQCGGEGRQGSGVMSFVAPDQWIDVRALTVSGEPVAWAQGYEQASAAQLAAQSIADPAADRQELIRAARVRSARPIEIEDVEDAARQVEARAVEVWVAAHETPFELSGGEILRLADAGVPESVIDVMVAVSYPDRFVLSPEGAPSEAEPTRVADGYGRYGRGYRTYLWNPFWGPSRFGYSRYYSPFGYYGFDYGGYGGYGGYWGYVPATIVVQPTQPGTVQQRGRVQPGRGYVRDTPSSDGSSGGSARPASSSGSGDSGGGGSSSGGGGGGSSSGDSGRRAVPRN